MIDRFHDRVIILSVERLQFGIMPPDAIIIFLSMTLKMKLKVALLSAHVRSRVTHPKSIFIENHVRYSKSSLNDLVFCMNMYERKHFHYLE